MKANVNGNRMSVFQNPDKKPLENLELVVEKDGGNKAIRILIPALSEEWMEDRKFLHYEAPCIYDENGAEIVGAKDRWLEIVDFIVKDLDWLLRLPFYKFWSNVIYNPTIGDSLVTILQELPTFYNLETFPNDPSMRELLEKLRRSVLVVYARLVSSKESKEEYMSHEVHGGYLYEQFLLTVPMMLDICQIYGRENGEVVERIISTAIKLQPAYKDDLATTVAFLTQVFKNVDQTFEDRPVALAAGAVPLSDRGSSHVLSLENLEDRIIHLLDASTAISVFLDVYKPARELFCNDDFVHEIVHVYGNTIPEMYRRLENLANNDDTVIKYTELKHRLDVTRSELRKIFRTVTYHNIARILEQPNPSEVPGASECVEQFVNFLEKAVQEREFIFDYEVAYPVETDLDLVSQISHDVDAVKLNFIKRSVCAQLMERNQRDESHPPAVNNFTASEAGSSGTNQIPIVSVDSRVTNGTSTKAEVDVDAKITKVKDVLCDLGEGFIERCLKHYNYDAEAVINAVLEDTLPESLQALDKMLPYIPPDPTEASAAVDQVLGAERLNVFDNDEFDIMTRDSIDKSRVHKGKKKDKYKNLNQLLDDKSYRKDVGDIYQKYSVIQDDYEDEYDDTYESEDVGPRGVDEPLEMDGRAFTTPRILRWNDKRETGGDDEDEEEIDNEASSSRVQNNRDNFVQDPAEVRARAEQRRLSKRGGGGGSWRGDRGPQPDLVGKPKGQGNEKNVLVNRDKKNTHKASRANHNRRSGAEHKRRQGMVPS